MPRQLAPPLPLGLLHAGSPRHPLLELHALLNNGPRIIRIGSGVTTNGHTNGHGRARPVISSVYHEPREWPALVVLEADIEVLPFTALRLPEGEQPPVKEVTRRVTLR